MKTFTTDGNEIRGLCTNFPETTYGAAAYVCEMLRQAYVQGRNDNEVLQKDIDNQVAMVLREGRAVR